MAACVRRFGLQAFHSCKRIGGGACGQPCTQRKYARVDTGSTVQLFMSYYVAVSMRNHGPLQIVPLRNWEILFG